MFSDIFKRASEITTAVISLVIEAIGSAVLLFLLYSTSPVLPSITSAARALTLGWFEYLEVSKICTVFEVLLFVTTPLELRILVVTFVEP